MYSEEGEGVLREPPRGALRSEKKKKIRLSNRFEFSHSFKTLNNISLMLFDLIKMQTPPPPQLCQVGVKRKINKWKDGKEVAALDL